MAASPQRGDGGLYSTARDYGLFIRMLLNGGKLGSARILSEKSVKLMGENHIGAVVVRTQEIGLPALSKPFPLGAGADKFGLGFQVAAQSKDAEIYRRAVDAFTGHFGREHYEVASTLHNLGAAEHALGNTDAARAHYDESIALMAIVRGLAHPDVALTQYNLAILHRDAGRPADAKHLLETALATLRATLGDEHPNTQACVEALAALA